MNKKLNVMIIGKGFIFSRHVESIEKCGGNVLITVDNDPNKKADFLNYKKAFLSSKFKDVNYIVICTPNDSHLSILKDCLTQTNKEIIIEKPAIISNHFLGIENNKRINCVLQLRYNPLLPELKKAIVGDNNKIDLIMKVYRDKNWQLSWKNNLKKSGGILMGIAIHMFDLLIVLLGNNYVVVNAENSQKKCTGIIKFPRATVSYYVEVMDSREGQTRKLVINDQDFELCNRDNLSFSGFHDRVYEELIKGNGIPLSEAKKSIKLVLKLKQYGRE